MEQLDSNAGLKERNCPAHCSRRPAELAGGACQATLVERCDKNLHGVDAIHTFLAIITRKRRTPFRVAIEWHGRRVIGFSKRAQHYSKSSICQAFKTRPGGAGNRQA